jgi:hypothetical protein
MTWREKDRGRQLDDSVQSRKKEKKQKRTQGDMKKGQILFSKLNLKNSDFEILQQHVPNILFEAKTFFAKPGDDSLPSFFCTNRLEAHLHSPRLDQLHRPAFKRK